MVAVYVAICAVIIAALALAWNIIKWWRDKGRLMVSAKIRKVQRVQIAGERRRAEIHGIFVTVTNTGGGPMSVVCLLIQHKKDGAFTKSPIKPVKTLARSETMTERVRGFRVSVESRDELAGIYAEDSTGSKWRLRRGRFKQLHYVPVSRSVFRIVSQDPLHYAEPMMRGRIARPRNTYHLTHPKKSSASVCLV